MADDTRTHSQPKGIRPLRSTGVRMFSAKAGEVELGAIFTKTAHEMIRSGVVTDLS